MEHDDPIDRRRAKQRSRRARNRLLLMAVVVGAAGAAAVLGVVLAVNRHRPDGGPLEFGGWAGGGQAAKPSGIDAWTYKEVAAHLDAKGFPKWVYRTYKGDALIYPPGGPRDEGERVASLVDTVFEHGIPWPDQVVLIRKMHDAESARQFVGHTSRPAYARQSWVFMSDPATIQRVEAAFR